MKRPLDHASAMASSDASCVDIKSARTCKWKSCDAQCFTNSGCNATCGFCRRTDVAPRTPSCETLRQRVVSEEASLRPPAIVNLTEPFRVPPYRQDHETNVVIDEARGLIYLENLKAASSTINAWMRTYLNATMTPRNGSTDQPNACPLKYQQRRCCHFPFFHTTSLSLGPEHAAFFTFSFVRDPISKFE